MKNKLQERINLLESITGKKVILKEVNEASKNLSVESLKALSDSLDMVKQNLVQALNQVTNLGNQDIIITKLKGLDSIVDSSLTDVSEAISSLTGMQTKEDIMLDESDENGIEMTIDDAVKNIDNVKSFADKGVNVIIDDDKTSF